MCFWNSHRLRFRYFNFNRNWTTILISYYYWVSTCSKIRNIFCVSTIWPSICINTCTTCYCYINWTVCCSITWNSITCVIRMCFWNSHFFRFRYFNFNRNWTIIRICNNNWISTRSKIRNILCCFTIWPSIYKRRSTPCYRYIDWAICSPITWNTITCVIRMNLWNSKVAYIKAI